MKHSNLPLYKALKKHISNDPVSYHVPGHKNGTVFEPEAEEFFKGILKIDATEISGLDDLHSSENVLLEAQTLLADLYGVKRSFFLVNGTTSGNLSMIMASCNEGEQVLVQRNSHKSILNALSLAKADPIFLEPEYNEEWKTAEGISSELVVDALNLYPDVKVIVLTYPNYYGAVYNLKEIIRIAHSRGIAVLVDEAHGAHFIAGTSFPPSAAVLGADIVVQSAHKTLPAMTMGSFIHFNSNLVGEEKLRSFLQMFQSSSPSYPIMVSLDLARSYLGTYSEKSLSYLLKEIENFREELDKIPQIKVLKYQGAGDPLKVTIQTACSLSGYELQQRFEEEGIYTELADMENVLFVLPLLKEQMQYPFKETVEKIKQALAGLQVKIESKAFPLNTGERVSRLSVSFREMDKLEPKAVNLNESEGLSAAETIIPYPPGIPLVLKGEKITREKLNHLLSILDHGAKIQGGTRLGQGKIIVF